MNKKRYTRRDFVKVSTLVTGGLMAGFSIPGLALPGERSLIRNADKDWIADLDTTQMNVFVKIAPNNKIVIQAPYPEIGQGIRTSLPLIIADEMDADWDMVLIEQAETNKEEFGSQFVGGSTAVKRSLHLLRKTGAIIKDLLIRAAANQWEVNAEECTCEKSFVYHLASNKKLSYGDLAEKAALLSPLEEVPLKEKAAYTLMGKAHKKVDVKNIVSGTYEYGMDVNLENMLFAVILRPPVLGSKLAHYKDTKAKEINGLVSIFEIPEPKEDFDVHRGGLVIVAKTSYAAIQARKALEVKWTKGEFYLANNKHVYKELWTKLETQSTNIKTVGNFKEAYSQADKTIEAHYELPFVAHANSEPQNTTVRLSPDYCEIWSPTQVPNYVRDLATKITGLSLNQVDVFVSGVGGGFGRRLEADYAAEALYIAKHLKKPVKLFWTREDDFTFDYFRSAGVHSLQAGIKNGQINAWKVSHASSSVLTIKTPHEKPWEYEIYPDNYPLAPIPNLSVNYCDVKLNIAVASLRAPGHSSTAYADGCFMDEIAHALKKDPISLHLEHLGGNAKWPYDSHGGPFLDSKRIKEVILKVKKEAQWGKPLAKGSAQGFAFHFTFGGYVALITQLKIAENGKLKVEKITAAVDIGELINPSGAHEQISGGIIDGLNMTLNSLISVREGKIEQDNYHKYPMLRMEEAPNPDIFFINTQAALEGVGEMGLPPVAASVCNAIFAITGKRIRSLPVRIHDLSYS